MKEVQPYHLTRINEKINGILVMLKRLEGRIVFLENVDSGQAAALEDLPISKE